MTTPTLAELIERRYSRRSVLRAIGTACAASLLPWQTRGQATPPLTIQGNSGSTLTFTEIPLSLTPAHQVPEGYDVQIVLRYGDPLFESVGPFEYEKQSAEEQLGRFGFNCDFIAYFPLQTGERGERGLLCVNHEFIDVKLMFPPADTEADRALERARIGMAAVGITVVEVQRNAGGWQANTKSTYNRRISAITPCRISGPARGSPRLATSADPEGRTVRGTLANCAGGVTPWGTYLSAEENIQFVFSGTLPAGHVEAENYQALGIPAGDGSWAQADKRFDLAQEPNEANRFGWIVEVDPLQPNAEPVKRTALGRFKHECATCVVSPDGRVSVYSGDDEAFQFLYRFVSNKPYAAGSPDNINLLDDGTLYAARFNDNGTLDWLPLVFGTAPLNASGGFMSQGDVLIDARKAAKLLGATPMDRPEDVETNPVTGRVYVVLTKNAARDSAQLNAANWRANNRHGHILELEPPLIGGAADHTALHYKWGLFIAGGNPNQAADQAAYNPNISASGWLSCPDNLAFDNAGRIWIATDGMQQSVAAADALYAADTAGPGRAQTKRFFSAPQGAEVTGPCFTPDNRTLFLSVQHPGADSGDMNAPTTRWPDFDADRPPLPTVVAITKKDGGIIGS